MMKVKTILGARAMGQVDFFCNRSRLLRKARAAGRNESRILNRPDETPTSITCQKCGAWPRAPTGLVTGLF